jgi:hypothetical protein
MVAAHTSRSEPETGDSSQEYCVIRGRTAVLRGNENALAALDRMVRDGVRAFPKRGLEIGGLLTGSSKPGQPAGEEEGQDEVPEEIRLETISPLPMEYRSSPAFQPSPADLLFIKQSVQCAQASEASIVGHFRSQTSGEIRPSDVDRNIASLLNLREAFLVLIPASIAGVEPARLYRAVNGEWNFLLSFPLVEEPLTELPPDQAPRPLESPPDMATSGPAKVPFRFRWYPWALAGLAVGVAGGVYLSHSVWQSRSAVVLPTRSTVNDVNSDLHLELHPSGSALTVQWNPASPPVAKGFSGMLTVQDGGRQLQIPLDRQQLETGHTIYYPESGWVEVRLEVNQEGNHFTGQTVAMATGLPKQQLPDTPVNANALGTSSAATPVTVEDSIAKSKSTGAPGKNGRQTQKTSEKPPLRRYRGPVASRLIDPLGPLPSAPQILLATPAPTALQPTLPPNRPPSAPQADVSDVSESAGPTIRYETAVPIRKVRPSIPEELHSILPESTSISIRVEIDAAGRVVSATPSGTLTPTQKLLAPQAVQAARLWRFQPARKNGEAVESESILKFDFERDR